jgi:RNA polymerase sigma-70 factor (ECF subfamily)
MQSLDVAGASDGSTSTPAERVADAGMPVSEGAVVDEQAERVRGVIANMPEHLRMILILGYYQRLPYAEIAEVLGIPVGTVKSRLHSAVQHFAEAWKQLEAGSSAGGDEAE